jgi:dimethylhistidine N-methyltransferase
MMIAAEPQFQMDVREGLCGAGQKSLPSKYFYDAMGSTLFEAITLLPQYGLTRAEERLLQRHSWEMARSIADNVIVAELGSGSGRKTRTILSALAVAGPITYSPIEISRAALDSCEASLADIDLVQVRGVEREYLEGLREVARTRPTGAQMLVLFLGSTIGNFAAGEDSEFLSRVRELMRPGDALLLGADLVKSREQMIDAYDDPLGVTAAFNLNMLARINRELDADFDLRQFSHQARFNERTSSIEMHLVSRCEQVVRFAGGEFMARFAEGETIQTETCHKYTRETISTLAAAAGFRIEQQWVDSTWPFADSLLVVS